MNSRARFLELKSQMASVFEGAKAENRALTDVEESQLSQYRSELSECQVEMQIEAAQRMVDALGSAPVNSERELSLRFAEALVGATKGEPLNIRTYYGNDRDSVAGDTGLTIGDIIEPLEKGNIMGLLGCHIQSGLAGDWKYPVVSAVEATIAGETAEIADSKLDISAVTPVPQRVALSILVSRGALNATNEELRAIVLNQIVAGMDRLLNKWMFKRSTITGSVNGLFVNPGTSVDASVSGQPTYAEILGLKGAVDSTGVKPDGTAAYVMTNAMKAYCEATPKVAGAAGMICENGKINGVPVYVTEYAPANCIEFGYFSYALVGQFGVTSILVDPYTMATSNSVRFVLNTEWDIKAARAEAFGILCGAAASN